MDNMLKFRSSHLQQVFTPSIKDVDASFQKSANKARFENYVAAYNALTDRCKCESEYDLFKNVTVWKDILTHFCDRTHSQYGRVAIVRAVMITVNKAFRTQQRQSQMQKQRIPRSCTQQETIKHY